VVNRDAGKFKSADLLSSFCDRVLKTGSSEKLSDTEMEVRVGVMAAIVIVSSAVSLNSNPYSVLIIITRNTEP
jgi:hypothetical protein